MSLQRPLGVYAIGRTNQLIVNGFQPDVERLKALVARLDVYIESTTHNYQFIYADVTEIYRGLEDVLNFSRRSRTSGDRDKKNLNYGLTLMESNNAILLTGPPSAHRIMASIKEMADSPAPYEAGVIRTYKLENTDVNELATILRELLETENAPQKSDQTTFQKTGEPAVNTSSDQATTVTETGRFLQQVQSRVSVSTATNSVVVQTTARKHREVEKLIAELDKRRLQVLIEVLIVEITTNDDLEYGVELSEFSDNLLAFTSFGLSSIDPVTGDRSIIVSPGGTGATIDPDRFKAIIKALKTNGRVMIQSAPRLLINDNATGIINSIAEEPYTQINASDTVATTSFGGFVEAGTQLTIIPHISEKQHLRVEYQIILNDFGAADSESATPPSRRTNSIQSEATIPDGHTIIVGGLQGVDESEFVDKVPLLGDLPLLDLLFSSTTTKKQYKTTYLFMTPSIMKSTDFSDLKARSEIDLNKMQKAVDSKSNIEHSSDLSESQGEDMPSPATPSD